MTLNVAVVTGATGKQGGAILSALSNMSHNLNIRAVSQSWDGQGNKAQQVTKQGAETVQADLLDKASLVRALRGADRAYLLTFPFTKGQTNGEVQQGQNFIDAANEAGTVKHIVFSSAGNADEADVDFFQSKAKIEKYLKHNWQHGFTIVRPAAFMDNFHLSGPRRFLEMTLFGSLLGDKIKNQYVAVEDIGRVVAQSLVDHGGQDQAQTRETIELAGDELSVPEMQDALGKATGSRPWRGWIPSFLLFPFMPKGFAQMFRFWIDKGFKADVQQLRSKYPGLLSFEDWARKRAKGKSA